MYCYIRKNIESARDLYRTFGRQLANDQTISCTLKKLKKSIQNTQDVFFSAGISAECKKCGENGEHCCSAGTENKYSDILLLVNLLLGNPLCHQPLSPSACGFLGGKGCTLIARHVICVNYLCKIIHNNIDRKRLIAVQQVFCRELDVQFVLCEKIKEKIREKKMLLTKNG